MESYRAGPTWQGDIGKISWGSNAWPVIWSMEKAQPCEELREDHSSPRNRDRSRDGKEAQVAQQWAWQGVVGVEVGEGSWAKLDSRALVQSLGCFLRAAGSHWTSGRWVPASHGRPRVLNRCTCLIRQGQGGGWEQRKSREGKVRLGCFFPIWHLSSLYRGSRGPSAWGKVNLTSGSAS